MITTTYNIGDTVYFYEGSTIEQVEIIGVVLKGSDESYFVQSANGSQSQRKSETLYASIDKLADQVVTQLRAKFEADVVSLKQHIETVATDYDERKKRAIIEQEEARLRMLDLQGK